ncbi:MAG: peptide-binding protein [Candidatus Muirbacterium halophilum]|nr:peptide-binding protein [Candidatus Muirbacterium halophilum]
MKIKIINYLLIVFFAFFVCGCGEKKDEKSNETGEFQEPVYGDTFVYASIGDAVTLNPLLYTDSASGDIISYVFSGLIKYSPKREIIPDMAEKWEFIENKNILMVHIDNESDKNTDFLKKLYNENKSVFSSVNTINYYKGIDCEENKILEVIYNNDVDNSEKEKWLKLNPCVVFVDSRYDIVFYIKDNIKWSDGVDFTSADVLFTYQKIVDPDVGSPRRSDYNMIKSVEIIDRYKVKVQYFKPFAPALESWMMDIVPKHILENEDVTTSKFNRKPVGTGSYVLSQWSADEYIILESNKKFFEGRPYLDKVMIKIIPDKSQQFLDLKNGLLDYMPMTPDQYKKQINTEEFNERFKVYQLPSSNYYSYVAYNCNKPPFDNVEIRNALGIAIDVNSIIDNVFYGMAKRVTGPFPIVSWAYNNDLMPLEFSIKKAKDILAKNGWIDSDGDGILDKEGKKLIVELMTNNGNKTREYMVNIISDYWKQIGVECRTKLEEWGNFLHLQDIGDYDSVLLGWSLGMDPDIYNIWHSDNIPNEKHPTSFNFMRYKNEKVDKLLEQARFTFDQEDRKQKYWEVHKLIADDQPYTFLVSEDSLTVLEKRFKGIKIEGNSLFYNFEKWFVPENSIKYK